MLKTLIVGIGKSGTTALYYYVLNNSENAIGIFEPRNFEDVKKSISDNDKKNIVCKVLIDAYEGNIKDLFSLFDKVVYITRDIRDLVISAVLFTSADIFYSQNVTSDRIRTAIELMRKKSKTPSLIAMSDILHSEPFTEVNAGLESLLALLTNFQSYIKDALNKSFVIRFEAFIDGKLDALNCYLEIEGGSSSINIPKEHDYVVRSKGQDSWKNWFIAKDVELYRPKLNSFLTLYGYDEDWRLDIEDRHIPDEIGYKYFQFRINHIRKIHNLEPIKIK